MCKISLNNNTFMKTSVCERETHIFLWINPWSLLHSDSVSESFLQTSRSYESLVMIKYSKAFFLEINLLIYDLFRDSSMNVSPFVGSPLNVVRKMLQLVEPKPNEFLYDLGSRDGRILIMAAKEFQLRCIGIEIHQDLFKKAIDEIKSLNLESRIKIINEDFFNVNISNADIVTLYLNASANEKLRPKLEKELKIGARVVSHDYQIMGVGSFKDC